MNLINWFKGNKEMPNEENKVLIISVKDNFNLIISDTIKPTLKEMGFVKKGLTFYKKTSDLIFVINFQNSHGNSSEQNKFYINCGIYSSLIDKTVDKTELTDPKEYDCHYNVRISTYTSSEEDGYLIVGNTDIENLKKKLLNDLSFVMAHFDKIKSLNDLTDLILNYNSLDKKLLKYFILTKDNLNIRKQIFRITEQWSKESRWERIKSDLNNLLREFNQTTTVEKTLTNE